MLKVLRIMLFWLLAFAVPVQGFAATTMLLCTGAHHRAEASVPPKVADEHHAVHEHADRSLHEHHGHHDTAPDPAQDVAAQEGGSHEGTIVHKTAGKCSACSACCMSVAIPTSAVRFAPLKIGNALVAIEFHTQPVFLTDGPERPPRPILA